MDRNRLKRAGEAPPFFMPVVRVWDLNGVKGDTIQKKIFCLVFLLLLYGQISYNQIPAAQRKVEAELREPQCTKFNVN